MNKPIQKKLRNISISFKNKSDVIFPIFLSAGNLVVNQRFWEKFENSLVFGDVWVVKNCVHVPIVPKAKIVQKDKKIRLMSLIV